MKNTVAVKKLSTLEFAQQLRREMTPQERILWNQIRQEQLGVKFRRQHPMGDYVVDFICLEKKLIIEVDGGQHFDEGAQQYDQMRTAYLMRTGHRILRFSNHDVTENLTGVLQTIADALEAAP